jgi:hypothetical protein
MLARSPTRQIPLHRSAAGQIPPEVEPLAHLKRMSVNYEDLARRTPEVDRTLSELLQQ